MTKKLICFFTVLLVTFSISFNAFANDEIDYYDEFDNYNELDPEEYEPVEPPANEKPQWYAEISPIPPAVGVAAGAAVVLILYRRHTAARRHKPNRPYSFGGDISHNVTAQSDDNSL